MLPWDEHPHPIGAEALSLCTKEHKGQELLFPRKAMSGRTFREEEVDGSEGWEATQTKDILMNLIDSSDHEVPIQSTFDELCDLSTIKSFSILVFLGYLAYLWGAFSTDISWLVFR